VVGTTPPTIKAGTPIEYEHLVADSYAAISGISEDEGVGSGVGVDYHVHGVAAEPARDPHGDRFHVNLSIVTDAEITMRCADEAECGHLSISSVGGLYALSIIAM
jgi:hypothetical protein